MISDEPDEDAETLDDEAVLSTYLGNTKPGLPATPDADSPLADWPRNAARRVPMILDSETVAWFQATHGDWQSAIRSVLRAWVNNRQAAHNPPPSAASADGRMEQRPPENP